MNDFNNLFKIVKKELTSEGQMFETRSITNGDNSYDEYVSFPENLKGYFDIAMLHADKEFIVYNSERYTFKDIYEKSAQFAHALKDHGIKKGDRIAVLLPQSPAVILMHLAAARLGAILIPLFVLFGPDALAYRLSDSGARLIVTDAENITKLDI